MSGLDRNAVRHESESVSDIRRNTHHALGESLPRDLYRLNAGGSGLGKLTDTPEQEERAPRVSPDGQWVPWS